MRVELTGISEEVVAKMIASGQVSTPEEAILVFAEAYLVDQAVAQDWDIERIDAGVAKSLASGKGSDVTPEYLEKLREYAKQHAAKLEATRRGD